MIRGEGGCKMQRGAKGTRQTNNETQTKMAKNIQTRGKTRDYSQQSNKQNRSLTMTY